MSLLGAALIGAGSNLIGGLLDRGEAEDAAARSDYWNEKSYGLARESLDWNKAYIQNRAADARAAGIHPLYAMGSPGVSASFTAGQAPTGSGLGTGIARAGEAVADMVARRNPLAKLQAEQMRAGIRATEASGARDEAEAMLAMSRIKRMEAEANSGPRAGVAEEIERVPLAAEPPALKSGVRHSDRYVRDDGSVGWKYAKDMEMEDLGQLVIAGQDAKHAIGKMAERITRGVRSNNQVLAEAARRSAKRLKADRLSRKARIAWRRGERRRYGR